MFVLQRFEQQQSKWRNPIFPWPASKSEDTVSKLSSQHKQAATTCKLNSYACLQQPLLQRFLRSSSDQHSQQQQTCVRVLKLSFDHLHSQFYVLLLKAYPFLNSATGNPNLDYKKESSSSKALVIGLAVGIPLIVIILLILLFLWIRSKRGQTHNQETETGNGSINAPQPSAPPVLKDEEDDYVAVNKIDERVDHTMVPDLDLDELEGLVDQYVNDGDHHQLRIDGDDDDDYVAVGDHSLNDESMVPDLDLEELHDVIHQEKQKAEELGKPKSDT